MNVCLYGASSDTIDKAYLDAAFTFGSLLARRGHTLIYGGGAQGIMGAAARGVRSANGRLVGIAPNFFRVNDLLFHDCTEFIYTETMQERKMHMISRSDCFVMAPGGFGTFEEFFEVLTLKQLGQHNPAIAILNTNGFYNDLQKFIEGCTDQHFIRPVCLGIYRLLDTPEAVVDYLEHFDPAALDVRHLKNI